MLAETIKQLPRCSYAATRFKLRSFHRNACFIFLVPRKSFNILGEMMRNISMTDLNPLVQPTAMQ